MPLVSESYKFNFTLNDMPFSEILTQTPIYWLERRWQQYQCLF